MDGQAVMNVSCRLDMPMADYHLHPALGSSTLKSLDRDGAQMTALRLERRVEELSRALVIGSALHVAVESESKLHEQYVAAPATYKSADSQKFEELQADTDRTLLTCAEMEDVLAASYAVRSKLASFLAGRHTMSEPSLFVDDPSIGVPLKCRPDLITIPTTGDIDYLEIKTAADVSPRGFRSAIFRYGYHLQQAHYERVIGAIWGRHVRTTFIVVSKTRPAVVRCYRIDDLSAAWASRRWEELVAEYKERVGTADWDDESIREPKTLELGMGLNADESEGDDDE